MSRRDLEVLPEKLADSGKFCREELRFGNILAHRAQKI